MHGDSAGRRSLAELASRLIAPFAKRMGRGNGRAAGPKQGCVKQAREMEDLRVWRKSVRHWRTQPALFRVLFG